MYERLICIIIFSIDVNSTHTSRDIGRKKRRVYLIKRFGVLVPIFGIGLGPGLGLLAADQAPALVCPHHNAVQTLRWVKMRLVVGKAVRLRGPFVPRYVQWTLGDWLPEHVQLVLVV